MNADTRTLSSLLFTVDEVLDAPGLLSFLPIRLDGLVVTVKSDEAAQDAGFRGAVEAMTALLLCLTYALDGGEVIRRLSGDTLEIRTQNEVTGRRAA